MVPTTRLTAVALFVLASCDRTSTVRFSSSESVDSVVPQSAHDTLVHGSGDFGVAPVYTRADSGQHPGTGGKALPPVAASESDSVANIGMDEEMPPPITDSTVFSCTPKSLRRGDTLTFRMKTPHGVYLSVKAPGNTSYYVVSPQFARPKDYSVVPAESFKDVRYLRIAADLRLPPAVYGKDTIPESVFSRAGEYIVSLLDNGGRDYGPPPFICTVSFAP